MTELDALMDWVGRRGYLIWQFQADHQAGPDIVAAVRDYGGIADVLILRSPDHACAYRMPTGSGIDVFNPEFVYWFYAHNAVWTIRALITLPAPGQVDAPTTVMRTPPGYGIPAEARMPVSIRKR
jgi:hypothetical protein